MLPVKAESLMTPTSLFQLMAQIDSASLTIEGSFSSVDWPTTECSGVEFVARENKFKVDPEAARHEVHNGWCVG